MKNDIKDTDIYLEMDWSDLNEDGTRRYPDKPENNIIPPDTEPHFTEYVVKTQDVNKIAEYAKKLCIPTEEEIKEYVIRKAKEDEELRLFIEESKKREPAFLSDEWRWAKIDANVEACKKYIKQYG